MNQEPKTTGPNLINSISAFIQRFVQFDDSCLYLLASLWVISTHIPQTFQYAGYLCAHSRIPGSGKSRLLEVLELIVANPLLIISPTEAVLFRTASGKTQLLDEGDGWRDGGEMVRSVLNSGFSKGKFVTRMMKKDGDYHPMQFDVFGPKAIAGLNLNKILDRTTLERTFCVELTKRKRNQKQEKFRPKIIKDDYLRLQQEITDWLQPEIVSAIEGLYDHPVHRFDYLDDFGERTIDISEPLAAILDIAFVNHGQLGEMRQSLKKAILMTRKQDRDTLIQIGILNHLAILAQTEDPLVGNPTELHSRCNGLADQIEPKDISNTLREHGFIRKSVRAGGNPLKRYSLPLKELQDILVQYSYK